MIYLAVPVGYFLCVLGCQFLSFLLEDLAEILHRASLAPKKTPCKNSAHPSSKKSLFRAGENRDFGLFR